MKQQRRQAGRKVETNVTRRETKAERPPGRQVRDKCKIIRPRVSKHRDKQKDKWRQVHPAESLWQRVSKLHPEQLEETSAEKGSHGPKTQSGLEDKSETSVKSCGQSAEREVGDK